MRILILAHFYPPEMGAAANRLHGLARWLVHFGHDVTVITGFPNYPSGVIPQEYRRRWQVEETLNGVRVIRTWVYASPKRGALRRLANYFSYVLSAIGAGVRLPKGYDVLMASSPPLFIGIAGWILSLFHRIPWNFDIRDIWPEVAVEAGEFAPNAPITRLGKALAHFLYRRADVVTPVTHNKRVKLVEAGVPEQKISVVTNGVDFDQIVIAEQDRRADLNLAGKFVVLYAGLIGIAQGVDIAVKAAHILREHTSVHFLIVGDGVKRDELAAEVASVGLSNVTLLPRQPRDAIPALMATADVCLVPLVSADLVDAVPTKLLEAWAYGRPVILAAGGEAAEITQSSGGGLVITPGRSEDLAEAVLRLYTNAEQRMDMAEAGRQYVVAHFSRQALAQQMEQVLAQLVNGV